MYYDNFCCDDITEVSSGELVDTRGGETYEDTYVCLRCKRVWTVEHGHRTHGTYQAEEVFKNECEYDEALRYAKEMKDE